MIELSYWDLVNPQPISYPFGTLRKPTLSEIAQIGLNTYQAYELLIGGDLKTIFSAFLGKDGETYYDSLSDDEKIKLTVYKAIANNQTLQLLYTSALNFFISEEVVFIDGYFILFKERPENLEEATKEQVRGVINEEMLPQVLAYIQQICCIYEREDTPIDQIKFKTRLAKKMYLEMREAKKEEERRKARMAAKEHSLANIVSAVSNMHPSLSPITIWNLTKFQLIDAFNRLRNNAMYDISWTRVAVWGDEKKQFDESLWYKNSHDE